MKTFTGGDKLKAALAALSKKVSKGATVNVGFMEGSFESDQTTPTAYVAYCNEYGGTIPERTVAAHKTTIYRRVGKNGNFLNGAKFVKQSKANFVTEHDVPEHVIPEYEVQSRPFFRRMIRFGKIHWGSDLGELLVQSEYDANKAMGMIGDQMADELKASIQAQVYVPLAKSTIAAKGNDTTLIDSSDMINSVKYEVVE